MNKQYWISTDTLTTIGKGALGAMTFGAYHQYNTNKIMELNNTILNDKHDRDIAIIKEQYQKEMYELREQINKIEKRSWWS